MFNLALFASGSGTNVQAIAEYFKNHAEIKVSMVLSNKPDAYVLERAEQFDIPTKVFNREQFYQSEDILQLLTEKKIDYIVLAGFLWLIPANLLKCFKEHIINIHPALLPKYGGKGMYGAYVHEAVLKNNEKETGITIHFADEEYDRGKIIFQAKCPVSIFDTAESIAEKVHRLEHHYFPEIIEKVIMKQPI